MLVELRLIFPQMFTGGMLCIILGYEKQLKIVCSLINKTVFFLTFLKLKSKILVLFFFFMVRNMFVCTLHVKKKCDCGIFWG